jgi:allantoicase
MRRIALNQEIVFVQHAGQSPSDAREWTRANLKSGDNMRVSLPSNAQVNGLALNQAIFYGQYASPCSERCAGDELALT